MEFLVGLSAGIHLGKIVSKYLEQFFVNIGLLTEQQISNINTLESIGEDVSVIVEELSSLKSTTKTINIPKYRNKKYISSAYNRR